MQERHRSQQRIPISQPWTVVIGVPFEAECCARSVGPGAAVAAMRLTSLVSRMNT